MHTMPNIIKTALLTLAALAIPAVAACQSEEDRLTAGAIQARTAVAKDKATEENNRVIANATAIAFAKTYTPTPTPTPKPKYVKVCIELLGASARVFELPRSGERVEVSSLIGEISLPSIQYIRFCGD